MLCVRVSLPVYALTTPGIGLSFKWATRNVARQEMHLTNEFKMGKLNTMV